MPGVVNRSPVLRPARTSCIRPANVRPHFVTGRNFRLNASAATAAVSTQLQQEVDELLKLHHDGAGKDAVVAKLAVVEQLGQKEGLNRVQPELLASTFRPTALSGQTKDRLENGFPLTMFSFGVMKPATVKVVGLTEDAASTIERGIATDGVGRFALNVVIKMVDHDLQGLWCASGTYTVNKESPSKLDIQFKDGKLSPLRPDDKEHLARWLALLQEHNPSMGADGVASEKLPPVPVGFHDYLVVCKEYEVMRANGGSMFYLQRE